MAHVLVVDDDPKSLYYQEVLLTAHEHRVVCARNGVEAMAVAQSDPPDVLLTDILMPQMDGFELTRRWVADARLRSRPVIVYTATYTDPSDEELALGLGARTFLRKPASPEQVLSALREAIDTGPARESGPPSSIDRAIYLEKYNSALVRKLEDKLEELARKNAELERSVAEREQSARRERELAEQLRQAQQLEALGQMAANVAHDFNNMLSAILGSVQLAQAALPAPHPAGAQLELTLEGIERATELVRQLLAIGRKQPQRIESVDLAAHLARLLPLLQTACGADVEVSFDGSAGRHFATVDSKQLDQVLLNLAINARDAMPAGGRLTLELVSLELADQAAWRDGLTAGDYELIRMRDTGVGMDAQTQRRVFEPYFTTKGPEAGSGLGLSTSYGLVRQSGGTIRITSVPGDGSTFEVLLPRASH